MTTSKKATHSKAEIKKLRLKKETIRDLDMQNKAKGIKGGSGTLCQGTPTINPKSRVGVTC